MTKSKNTLFGLLGILIILCIGRLVFFKNNTHQVNEYSYLTGHISYQDDAMLWEGGEPSSYYTVWLHMNTKNKTVQDVWNVNSIDSNNEYTILLGCVDKGGKELYAKRTFIPGTFGSLDAGEGHIFTGYNIIVIETGIQTNIPGELSGKIVGLSLTRPITAYPLIQDMPDARRGMCEAYAKVKDITILGDYIDPAIYLEDTFAKLPLCKREDIKNDPVLIIDTLVKDCSVKKTEGKFLEGLGGFTPDYILANGTILSPTYDTKTDFHSICKDKEENRFKINETRKDNLSGAFAIEKIMGKGLLNSIVPNAFPDKMWCSSNDTECNAMIDYEGWTDGSNYFVAGYRYPLIDTPQTHYVINGKLYNPGQNIKGTGFLKQSKWNFVGIQDNKAIVRRIIKGRLPSGITIDQAFEKPEGAKVDISIETCSIDL